MVTNGLNDQPTYYDVLDIKPDASAQEIRGAYLRLKAAYNKDSVALYTLIDSEEREDTLKLIEEAYLILSSEERRKEYDRCHGLVSAESDPGDDWKRQKVVSIDRVPPMEASDDTEVLLVPPTTDFQRGPPEQTSAPQIPARPAAAPIADSSFAQELSQEVEWKGALLRKVREVRKISLEELSGITKITKSYLVAIEEENFPKLPAAVFLRGFLVQIARVLKLPTDKVSSAYLARYHQARSDQTR